MRLIKQVTAGLLLSFAFLCLIAATDALLDRNPNRLGKRETALAGFTLGFPPALLGVWLVWGLHRQGQKEECDRLSHTFFRLIHKGNGNITVLQFAREANLPGAVAKEYLNQKAREFDASFEVNEEGGIAYHFYGGELHETEWTQLN